MAKRTMAPRCRAAREHRAREAAVAGPHARAGSGGASGAREGRLVVVGAGGNIGSHLVPHLARMAGVEHVTLVDRDLYEAKNLDNQEILPRDVGHPKAAVQAGRLRRMAPHLKVRALSADVERLPWGCLRSELILACLDSRRARQHVNEVARRLGIPWVDAGVDGGGLLVRLDAYVPGADEPCLECAWDARDYELLEQKYPCNGEADEPPATAAPSSLGALAAALQAIEAAKLLTGATATSLAGARLLIDATHHRHFVVRLPRRADCRLVDHASWKIERLAHLRRHLTLAQVFELGADLGPASELDLAVPATRFVRHLVCPACGACRSLFHLEASLTAARRRCRHCGSRMHAAGFDRLANLKASSLPAKLLDRPLHRLGFRENEVFTVAAGRRARHFEIVAGES